LADPRRTELLVKNKRCVLAGVVLTGEPLAEREPLEELRGLAKTGEALIVGSLVQQRREPDHKTYIGKGKIDELKRLVEDLEADAVIFDTGLTPGQMRALEDELQMMIVDRNELILAIFAEHARSAESKLQVELAQLLYMRPRLTRMWVHLERLEGAIGSRGPGEQQLETDRRLIDHRVTELQERLQVVEERRERMVAQRHSQLTVSLVGYTNAGKSTLMNSLTGAGVYVADQLFATLDTRTRAWKIPHFGRVLLSDTVGFIRNLPHNLVASFRSTLEEARHADVLLHVVDASHPAAELQIKTVNEVLQEIGIDGSRAILVLNKVDAVADRSYIDVLRAAHPVSVTISAVQKTGLAQLISLVVERLSGGYVEAELETSVANGKLFAFLAEHAEVRDQEYTDNRVKLFCRIPQRFLNALPGDDLHVHLPNGNQVIPLPELIVRPPEIADPESSGTDAVETPEEVASVSATEP